MGLLGSILQVPGAIVGAVEDVVVDAIEEIFDR